MIPAVAPESEKELFTAVGDYWNRYRTARFHDYVNQSSRILAESLPLARTVRDGDRINWQGLEIGALATVLGVAAAFVTLARIGQNLSEYGVHYSHFGLAYRDNGKWRVIPRMPEIARAFRWPLGLHLTLCGASVQISSHPALRGAGRSPRRHVAGRRPAVADHRSRIGR